MALKAVSLSKTFVTQRKQRFAISHNNEIAIIQTYAKTVSSGEKRNESDQRRREKTEKWKQ
jgi:hypothetical protein